MVTSQERRRAEWAIGSLRASPLFPFLAEISLHGSQSKYQRNSITQVDKYTLFRIQFKYSRRLCIHPLQITKKVVLPQKCYSVDSSLVVTKNGPHGLYNCNRLYNCNVYLCIMHICKSRPFKGLNLEFGPMILGILYKSDRRIPQHYFLQRLHVQIC